MNPSDPKGLRFEVSEAPYEPQWTTTTIHLHGTLVSSDVPRLRELVNPLILKGGHILLDCTEIDRIDSSGLGALVGLKVSAINHGHCTLELVNLSKRVKDLLYLTKLTDYLARPDTKLY